MESNNFVIPVVDLQRGKKARVGIKWSADKYEAII